VCSTVVVLGGEAAETLPGVEHIADLREAQGPLGGLEALLASGRDTEYLVCPCDLPLVTAGVLRRLTAAADAMATVFTIEGERAIQPLPARISASALDLVRSRLDRGERAVHRLMEALEPEVVPLSKSDAKYLTNVNDPSDYTSVSEALTDR
ncbi:MAG: molybdenum cofactor guanylyltransferase, partial [Planctomycetota bacterium]|jgi:molybdopterin-guanine dinucleotide biosynthesis protein A